MTDETNSQVDLSYIRGASGAGAADDDAGLVQLCQKGNLAAFETLVNKHQKRMLNISFRITNDYEEACEVVQDTFVAAYKNIKTFRGDSKFTTWLTSIVVNLSKNRIKQMRTRQEHEAFSLDAPVQTGECEITIDPPSKEPSALDRLEERDVRQRVQDCIKALEPDFREVLVLRDMQEFSYEEIGQALKMREGTVKSRLFRAREAIKDCLKKVMGEL